MPRGYVRADVSQLVALARDFEAAADRVASDSVRIVTEVAAVAESMAKSRVPVNTGRLRDSIHTRMQGTSGIAGVRAVVEAQEFYGWMVEAGTARQRPQPFMAPAAEHIAPILEDRLQKSAEKAVG